MYLQIIVTLKYMYLPFNKMSLIVLLLQELLLIHPLASVLNVTREPDSPTLIFTFRGDMTEFKVQVESPAHAWEMVNVLEQCKGDRMVSNVHVYLSEDYENKSKYFTSNVAVFASVNFQFIQLLLILLFVILSSRVRKRQ